MPSSGGAGEVGFDLDPYYHGLAPSPTLHINEIVNRLWREGRIVYHLGFGESRFPVHPKLLAALEEHGRAKSYLAAQGLFELREAVAGYYTTELGQSFSSEQVIVGPGSKALIFALQMALAADLFLPSPAWVSYEPQGHMLGKDVHYVPSRAEDNYALDLDALGALIDASNANQHLLVLTSPNNPTGMMLDDTALADIAAFCRERNVIVLSDEIYFRVSHSRDHHSIVSHYPEGTIVMGGLSKHLSIGGWRVGVALLPDTPAGAELRKAMTAIASEVWSAVASPVQHAAIVAYSHDPDIEAYTDTCAAIHGIRTRFLRDRLMMLGIHCTPADGGFYVTANFDAFREPLAAVGVHTSADLANWLIDEFAIATLPCSAFGLPESMLSLRLASSYLDMETDADGERVLEAYRTDPSTLMGEAQHPNFHACLAAFGRAIAQLDRGS